jgi:hypothetical protein
MPDTHTVTIDRVKVALEDVAYLVTKDSRYLPVFERLFNEHQDMQKKQDMLSRAHSIVKDRIVPEEQAA